MGSGKGTGRRESPAQIRKRVAQHETQRLLACGRLEVLLTSVSIGGGCVVLAVDEAKRSAWRGCLITSVEVVGKALFQVAGVSNVELTVSFGE